MASKTEGIALLSMYNDEEEEEEEEEEEQAERGGGGWEEGAAESAEDDPISADDSAAIGLETGPEKTPPAPQSRTPTLQVEDVEHQTLASPALLPTPTRTPTPKSHVPTPTAPSLSPLPAVAALQDAGEVWRSSKRSLTIVDYAHDETAMSPDTEEGEITSAGRVVFAADFHASIGSIDERISPVIAQAVTPSAQPSSPQHNEQPGESRSEIGTPTDILETEQEALLVEMDVDISAAAQQDLDPLSKFLPPPVTVKCSEELQEKINKFLAYKRAGKSFNVDLRNKKDYRNPDFLQHAVTYQDIDQIGTCFSKDVFDPRGYDKSDYYDVIEADMKREVERREQERKRSPKVDFVAGGKQPAMVVPASKVSVQVSGVQAVAPGGLQSASTAAEALPKDGRQHKRSKWDKVDTDIKNPPLPGHDAVSSTGVHAAILSAAHAGAGYTAFAQQKRREAEEKKSSERKFEKRS